MARSQIAVILIYSPKEQREGLTRQGNSTRDIILVRWKAECDFECVYITGGIQLKKWLYYSLIVCLLLTSVPAYASADVNTKLSAGIVAGSGFEADAAVLPLPAFPTAEGGGKYVTGGRGKDVYEVTTLEDYAQNEAPIPGSLRDAVSAGDRTIVFRVGGTVHLKESLKVMGSNLTIAGQTAPGDGITVSDYTTSLEADNIIIRYIRFRLGDRFASEDDAFGVRYHKNIIIDHCSFSWSVDEVVSLYDNVNTTVQWSISSESMLMTSHQKGRHGYGGIWGGRNASYLNNLIAHSTSRNPRFPTDKRELDMTDMSNNVIYNWGFASSYGGGEGSYNVRNNYYKYGLNTYQSVRSQLFGEVGSAYDTNIYIGGNFMDGNASVTGNNWLGVQKVLDSEAKLAAPINVRGDDEEISDEQYGFYEAVSSQEAYERVLADSGATLPKRDAIDARVINDVRNRTGQHINSPKEVGGYAEHPLTLSTVADQDKDGMDDVWEQANGLSAADSEDGSTVTLSPEGYTNLEVYLNALVPSVPGDNVDNPAARLTSPSHNSIIEAGSDLTVEAEASDKDGIAKVEFYIDGMKAGEDMEAPYRFQWANIADGTHYIIARAVDRQGLASQSPNAAVHANTTTDLGPWQSVDIGNVGIEGHAQAEADQSITLKSGGDIGGTADAFHFLYQKLEGNGEVIARIDHVTATDDNAEAGLMIRESLEPGARMALIAIPYVKNGKQAAMIGRKTNNGDSDRIASEAFIQTPYWLRLVRLGDQLTGLVSPDGISKWTRIGSFSVDFADNAQLYAGLAVDASKAEDSVWKYNTSSFSGAQLKALAPDFPAAPAAVTASIASGDKQVQLTWSPADANAKSYIVKRGDIAGGPYKEIANVASGTTYTDENVVPDKSYYYTIVAVNSSGLKSYESQEVTAVPTGDPENIYYVDDHFEEEELAALPAAYKASFPGNGGVEKVEVAPVPNGVNGNPTAQALLITDQGNATENAQSVSLFRQFESQKGTVIIDADFMLTEESGNAVLFQIKSFDDSKRAFSIGIRKPTAPENANKSAATIVYDNGSSSFYALSDETFAQYKDKWQNIKLVLDVAAGQVTIYLNGKEIGTFDDYKDKDTFKKMGVGRIYSATAGGGTGTYYMDNLKVYVEPIASPKGLNAMPGNGAIQLAWSETPGALSYNVFRSETDGGPYTFVPSTEEQPNPVLIPAARFVDASVDNDKTYYYVITANSPTGESGYSNQAQAMPSEAAAKPDAPAGLRATARNAQLELEWHAVPNAVSYELKRSSSAAGPFETVMSKITDTAYRLGSVPNDEIFYYVVSAKSVGGEGPNSEPISAAAYAPPGTPKAELHEGKGYIQLSWAEVDADSYIVKRAAKADGPYETIAEIAAAASFKDVEAAEGTPYYYTVSAVSAGVVGVESAIVSGRPANTGNAPGIPDNLFAESNDTKIHLTWTASEHAETYEVLRSISENGPFTVIASGIAMNQFTESGLPNGQVYHYTVAARNADGRSFASEIVKAMPAAVLTVAKDGSGDYATVQAAIEAVPDNGVTPAVIRIKDGIYHEKVFVAASKKQISLIGESRENTVIINGDTARTIGPDGKELGTSNSYTMKVSGTDITLANLTVKNSAGIDDGQAVALYAEGDRGIYRNVKLIGFQDTLLADKGRSYFVDSYIAGSVDFIFGNAPAVFNHSILHSAGPGYVTAASTAAGKPGYVFLNSRLTAEPGLTGKVDLGRPWRPDANVVFVNAVMDDHIKPAGWNNWGNGENEKTARFGEYGSQGSGANAAQRVNWSTQLTPEEAAQYTIENVLGGTDGWNPEEERIFPDSNSTLAHLNVNGIPVDGFSPNEKSYRFVLPEGMTDVPALSAEPFATAAEIVIMQADAVEGTASVRVTAMDGSISLYTVRYELASEEKPDDVGIHVDIPALTLEAGDSAQIKATVTPKEADQAVSWSGSDSIIHVSETGLITGLKPGKAKATVTSVTYSTYSTGVDILVQDRKEPVWNGGQLTVSQVTKNSVTLNWQAALDYVGVEKYAILMNGKPLAVAAGSTHTYKIDGLSKATAYEFQVIAYDGEQNGSLALKATATTKHDNGNGNGNGNGDGNEIAEPFVSLGKDAFQLLQESSVDGAKAIRLMVDKQKFAQAWDEAARNQTNKVVLNAAFIQDAALMKMEIPLPLPAGTTGVAVTVQFREGTYDLPMPILQSLSGSAVILTIGPVNGQLLQLTESKVDALGGKLAIAPLHFNLSAEVNGALQSVSEESVYARLSITLPNGLDPAKAAGVIIDSETGELRFVPTKFSTVNGIAQAELLVSAGDGGYAVIELSKSFPDTASHWAEQEINVLASKLLVQGNAAGMFEPDREISRAEFAALLIRSLGLSERQADEAFKDVAVDAWYAGSIAAAVQIGLMKGSGNGNFRPEDRISREEMVVMIARAAAFAGQESGAAGSASQSFSDYGDISDWAKDSVDWAAQAGLVNGLGDGTFAPGYETNRAQAVVMIKRMLQSLGFIN